MIHSPFRERCRRTFWPFLLGCLLGALLLALASHGLPSAWAEVRATPQREAFKAGGERSEVAVREVIDILKKMDGRLERIEQSITRDPAPLKKK